MSDPLETIDFDPDPHTWAVLSAEEKETFGSHSHLGVRRQRVVSRILVRQALSEFAAGIPPERWTLSAEASGRPVVSGPERGLGLSFSLSHTDDRVACLVAFGAEVGVDIEPIDRQLDSGRMARRYFAKVEADAIEALSPDRRSRAFVEWWTLKESWVKARGLALAQHLDRVCFAPDGAGRPGRFCPDDSLGADSDDWQFVQLRVGAHVVAVALRSDEPRRAALEIAGCSDRVQALRELGPTLRVAS